MESLPSINSEPLHKHHPGMPSAQNPVTSYLGNNGAWAFRRLPLVDRFLGQLILCQAMGLVTSLNSMDTQMSNLGLHGTWVLLYFGLMELCCVVTGSWIIFIHWRKKLQWESRAHEGVQVMNASTFIYSSLLYWINMQRCHCINAAIQIGPLTAVPNTEMKDHIPYCLWKSDTHEARDYGLSGSIPKTETPVVMKAALVVSGQPIYNPM
ncbi:Testis-expressed sequence 38 protein [Sciurus carolinensis]|uniref:Testis-expressed sequence 38 protein n=1 Tax=Sciurus carolinensis TaxID=30640 RepID=A0AA41MLH9_SCICA|nr:Testis-expressed sequence 38 protein [Sciurus carolinensis]